MQRPQVRDAVQIRGLFLLFGFAIAAFFPFVSLYLESYHGLSGAEVGLALAVASVVRMAANPVWGHVADTRTGRLTALQIGLAGSAFFAILLNLVDPIGLVIAMLTMHSLFMISQGPNADAIALTYLGQGRMSEYGRIRSWESVTYATGCLVFGIVLQSQGLGWEMPIYAMCVLAVLAWSTTIRRDRPGPQPSHGRLGAVGAVFRAAPRFWGFLAAVLLVWTGFNAAWNFIAIRIADAGGGPFLIGVGTALGGVVEVFTMRSSSKLQRRFGLRKIYILGCLIYAGGFLLWGSISDPTVLSVVTMFEGAGFSLLFTSGVVIVGRLIPSSLYSSGNSLTSMVGFGIGPIIGAGIGGVVYEHAGPMVLYTGASALAALAAVVAWFALDVPVLRHRGDVPVETEPLVPHPEAGPMV
jgi:PPP family 3-phenylpropionic acid transporter